MEYGEIVIGERVFKHGDCQLLDDNDPATKYLKNVGR